MQLSVERRSFLSGEHRHLGWIEVPTTAPLHIKNRIVEWRHANIDRAASPALATNKNNAARKAKAEQLLKEIAAETATNMKRLKLRYANLFS